MGTYRVKTSEAGATLTRAPASDDQTTGIQTRIVDGPRFAQSW